MKKNNDIRIISIKECVGCGSCVNICHQNAIRMIENEEGFLFPQIIEKECISCGMCLSVCPCVDEGISSYNLRPDVYAAQASDELRIKSSSGGVFSVFAGEIIEKGGIVSGAAYTSDYRAVHHIIIDKNNELESLRGSKYLQSDMGEIYKKINQMLKTGRKVLFSGTPCQVAAVRKFVGENENLITIDIICHGVPSPKAYRNFLDTVVLRESNEKRIKEFSFRNKRKHGWAHSVYAVTEDGYEYSKNRYETSWYNAFLNILNCRESCGNCRFNKIPRTGDITLGDFWAIDKLPKEWDDGKGTSLVCVNTKKGEQLFKEVLCLLKTLETSLDVAKNKNGNLIISSTTHPNRDRFFELIKKGNSFDKSTEYALKRKFDIGYVGWWYGKNYGSVLTNYALWYYLNSLNYTILMLEWPIHKGENYEIEDTFSRRFAKKNYEMSIRRTYDDLYNLNWFCDAFVVGSDQLWNYWSTKNNGSYFFLDFVEDTKKKVAYATSFGHPTYGAPKHVLKHTGYHLSRFDAVSVREKDGVDICRKTFGVDAVQTLDPVFLNKSEVYEKLCEGVKVQSYGYIFAYILSPSEEKRNVLIRLSELLNKRIVLVLDAAGGEKNKTIMNMPNSLIDNLEVEEWLSYLYRSDYVYTDSFHALCFSIIFHKRFTCIANIRRGISRFNTIMEITELYENMVFDPKDILNKKTYLNNIDYDRVDDLLKPQIYNSKRWLNNALKKNKPARGSAYDLLVDKIRMLEERIEKLEK